MRLNTVMVILKLCCARDLVCTTFSLTKRTINLQSCHVSKKRSAQACSTITPLDTNTLLNYETQACYLCVGSDDDAWFRLLTLCPLALWRHMRRLDNGVVFICACVFNHVADVRFKFRAPHSSRCKCWYRFMPLFLSN